MKKKSSPKRAAKTQHRKGSTKRTQKKFKAMPKPGDAAFAKLQKQWYGKLEREGFEDLEWVDHKTGLGQDSDFLVRPSAHVKKIYKADVEQYFAMVRNYVTWKKPMPRVERFILSRYAEGMIYKDIAAELSEYRGEKVSIFFIWKFIKGIKPEIVLWNETHEEGLLNPRQTDIYLKD